MTWPGVRDIAKFTLFSVGVGAAVASSLTSFFILYQSLLGRETLLFEHNPILAFLEMVVLILAVGTCVAAPEIYYKYLEIRRSMPEDAG